MENQKKIVEIQKNLGKSEVEHNLLLFRVENADLLPNPNERVTIIDEDGREYVSKIHSKGCRIDGLRELYANYQVDKDDRITIELDEDQKDVIRVSFDKFENLEGVKVTPLENTIRDLLADNLSALGKELKLIGKEYQVNDQCRIDILCQKANSDYVVIELKKDSSSDKTVGQILRYMGCVKEKLAPTKNVTGIIVTGRPKEGDKGDRNLQYAVSTQDNVTLRYYDLTLKLV